MISSWLLYIYLCFTSLWYLPDYCTCAFPSSVYDIFLIIVHMSLPLYFISLWYPLDYCTYAFPSPVYDIFLIIEHVPLLHQSMISSWLLYLYLYFSSLYLPDYCTVPLLPQSMISSWLLYVYLYFSSLYLPDYCTCTFTSPVYDIFLIIVHLPLLHQSMISSWLL